MICIYTIAKTTTVQTAMYVCICKAISDQDIKDAVNDGIDDLNGIQAHLGAATGCGSCVDHTLQVIEETLAQQLFYAA
jgi:bacterioferritin-associated ferredoxin